MASLPAVAPALPQAGAFPPLGPAPFGPPSGLQQQQQQQQQGLPRTSGGIHSSNRSIGLSAQGSATSVRLHSSLNASTASALVSHLQSGSRIRLRVIKGGASRLAGLQQQQQQQQQDGGARSQRADGSIASSQSFRGSGSIEGGFPFGSGFVTNEGSFDDFSEKDLGPIPLEDQVPMMAVLEDMLDQLNILENISPAAAASSASGKPGDRRPDSSIPSEQRLGKRKAHEFISQNGLNSIIANEQKVEAERGILKTLVETTQQELGEGHFGTLITHLQQEYATRGQLDNTIMREHEASETLRQLRRELEQEHRAFEDDLASRNQIIQELKDTIHEIHTLTSAEQKYMKKEIKAHEASLRQQCGGKESAQTEEKQLLQMQIRQEQKVHDKIASFLNQQREALERQIQDWMSRYEEDTEAKASELETIKQHRSADLDRFEELAARYEELEKLVDEDRKTKAREAELERIRFVQDTAATRIQAWWRGWHFRKVELEKLIVKKPSGKGGKGGSAKAKKGKKGAAGDGAKKDKKKGAASPKKKKK